MTEINEVKNISCRSGGKLILLEPRPTSELSKSSTSNEDDALNNVNFLCTGVVIGTSTGVPQEARKVGHDVNLGSNLPLDNCLKNIGHNDSNMIECEVNMDQAQKNDVDSYNGQPHQSGENNHASFKDHQCQDNPSDTYKESQQESHDDPCTETQQNQAEPVGETLQIADDTNKMRVVCNLNDLKYTGGMIFIGYKEDVRKTDPLKITEWFPSEFLSHHGVYAIREEEPFLLRIYTKNHESTNRGIRKKGGRKVMLMGQEIFGDVLSACGHCGYWSHEGSNVRRHLRKSVCLKERGYSKEDLAGLDRSERRKFLRRVASKKFRAKQKEKGEIPGTFAECLVEIHESCETGTDANKQSLPNSGVTSVKKVLRKVKRKPPKYKALTLGPAVVQEVVQRVPFDIYTVNENNERVAWKPPTCHKCSPGDTTCQIVFKGARMKRRCMDVPIPLVLIYRKLDCKIHHCNFTLFHPSAREAFKNDESAKSSVNVKLYGDIAMTREFYHYFVSLLSIMKMKSSQTARHLTSVWETIIAERLGTTSIPDEHRKIITLSKQTVKSIWSSIEEEVGHKNGTKLMKGPRKKKKPPPPPLPHVVPTQPNMCSMEHQAPLPLSSCGVTTVQVTQPGMQHHCMKHMNIMPPKHPPPSKPHMMAPMPPPHNHMQQPPPAPVNHPHWLGQAPQYPHNMGHYAMAPPPTAEYYPMSGPFMTQYAPATMDTSP